MRDELHIANGRPGGRRVWGVAVGDPELRFRVSEELSPGLTEHGGQLRRVVAGGRELEDHAGAGSIRLASEEA